MVIHVPHASTVVPDDVISQFVVSPAELALEIGLMTDHLTDRLYASPSATIVRFPVSRLVVDPERFESDDREVMASRGLGVIYTRTSGGASLRRVLTTDERERLLDRYYRPHHAALTAAVAEQLDRDGHCSIIDAHSFPSRPLPYELQQDVNRPDICIGTDDFHTPAWLRERASRLCADAGWTVEIDRPFAGALVPMRYFGCDQRVRAIMIEVNRRLYLDETSFTAAAGFDDCRERLTLLIRGLANADEAASA